MNSRWFDYTEPFRTTYSQGDQGVYGTLAAIRMNLLKLRFSPTELCNISWSMLTALESYTNTERASQESFFETYVDVIIETAKLERSPFIETEEY